MKKVLVLFCAVSMLFAVTAFAADDVAEPAAPGAAAPVAKIYGMNIGDNIRPIVVSSLDGSKKVDLEKVTGKTLFMMVSTVCGACKTEMNEMIANAERFKGKIDVNVVLIDMDAKSAAARMGEVPFQVLTDSEYKIGYATNLLSSPSTLIVENGKILYSKSGYRPEQWKDYLKAGK